MNDLEKLYIVVKLRDEAGEIAAPEMLGEDLS